MRIAIVEDENAFADSLRNLLHAYGRKNKEIFEVSIFTNGNDFLAHVNEAFQLVFMDIGLPDLNGIAVARKMREANNHAVLIFLTALSQYAIEGYEVDAYAYMLKPLKEEHFNQKMDAVMNRFNKRFQRKISFLSGTETVSLNLDDVIYIESSSHHCFYHLSNGQEIKQYTTLKTLEENYSMRGFARVSGSFLINLMHMGRWSATTVLLENGIELPLSRRLKPRFLKTLALWQEDQ